MRALASLRETLPEVFDSSYHAYRCPVCRMFHLGFDVPFLPGGSRYS